MNETSWASGHRRYRSRDGSMDYLSFSQQFTSTLGSPFLSTTDLPPDAEFVDGAPVYVPSTQTITRPSSPTPTVDSASFSFIHPDPYMPRGPLKTILPRLWHVINPGIRSPHSFVLPNSSAASTQSLSKGKAKIRQLEGFPALAQYIDYTDLPPLDGEEGELITIDDEACFFDELGSGARAVTGIDIMTLLPTELSLYILSLVCTSDKSLSHPYPFILSHSNAESSLCTILACLCVSKAWRSLAADNTVWRALFLCRWPVDLTRHRASTRHTSTVLSNESELLRVLPVEKRCQVRTTSASIKSFKMKIRKKRSKQPSESIQASSGHGDCSPLSSSSSSSAITNVLSSSKSARTCSPCPSDVLSGPLRNTSDSKDAPLRINWYALYRERLELDKRWNGSARVPSPPALFMPEGSRMRTPSTSASSSHGNLPINVFPVQAPISGQVLIPPNTMRFSPQVLSIAGHMDSVYCLEFDSRRIITGSRDRTIKVWSLKGKLLGSFGGDSVASDIDANGMVHGHTGSVLCLKFSVNWDKCEGGDEEEAGSRGSRGFMVSGSSDCTICVWNLFSKQRPGRPKSSNLSEEDGDDEREVHAEVRAILRGHVGGVLDLKIDEKWIVSCSKDALIHIWNRDTLELCRTLRGHEGPVNAVGLQSGKVVSASGDGKMILWDIESGERIRTFEGHDRGLACIEFKDDVIVSGSNDCKIKIWSASKGNCIQTLGGHDALVRALSFDPRSGRLVSASYDKSVKVWDLTSGKLVREFKNIHTSHIFDVKFDATRIVSTSHDRRIVVLDFSQGLDTSAFI